ncbi:hypothetical protein [Paraburkholderia saeva]|uniref:hypothetical protein n=1 Tax=Paraburkholderia saeva TaxID=2777537 RepID=UPI001D9A80ED|nr:hypothetical protein [Paraburkholderia saeva]CAG4908370.1 hypothetical protein R52603_03621 [Paraburkholderia saeva]
MTLAQSNRSAMLGQMASVADSIHVEGRDAVNVLPDRTRDELRILFDAPDDELQELIAASDREFSRDPTVKDSYRGANECNGR